MLKVMIVDDEDRIRLGIEKILSKYPGELCVVGSYSNGLDAMLRVSEMGPDDLDVVIADIEMPVVDGLKFIAHAKSKLPDVCIIVLSGYNDFEYARQAMRSGATDYFLKPMDKSEVFRLLHRCEQEKRLKGKEPSGVEAEKTEEATPTGVIEQIRNLVDKEYNRSLDLKYIAGKVGFNPSYISKLFSQDTGETITDYINRVRMDKAKQFLLDHPSLKVYEIAHLVGYHDKVYFQKLFKKTVGATPLEYRDQCGG